MLKTFPCSIAAIRDEARSLVEHGKVSRHQPIHALCRFFTNREWLRIERELELHHYLLRDPICDLVGNEYWSND
ncbi:MAG: DUF4327 family protein [Pseudanabaenaceae cyanobacterium]